MYPVYDHLKSVYKCEEVPVAFPPQQQSSQPGVESLMKPRSISENPYYRPAGKLKDKCAVITGGDSGIGRAVAYAFAAEGADLVIAYRSEHQDAEETRKRVEALGRRCVLVPCDLKKEAASQRIVWEALHCFGKIDILVNNAAVQYMRDDVRDITERQLDETFRTNVYAVIFLIKAALPYMRCGGSIINTASVTAYRGSPELLDYSAAKGAVVSLTRSLSLKLEERGIRVNAVAPGPIWTPLIPASYPAEQVALFGTDTSRVPMDRAGQPFEAAGCYVFLASDDASYMSGQVLHPNGGEIVGG